MAKLKILFGMCALLALGVWAATAVAAGSGPSGEVLVGGHGTNGGSVVEPVFDDQSGALKYVSTPRGTPDPVKANPRSWAPLYLPVYPTGFDPGATRLNCEHYSFTSDNCPDHGTPVAAASWFYDLTNQSDAATGASLSGSVYTSAALGNGVVGHDHLMAGPASGGDFNIAWVPVLVLFTAPQYVHRVVLESELDHMRALGQIVEIPLDGTEPGLPFGPGGRLVSPNLTFHCSVVPASVYNNGIPYALP